MRAPAVVSVIALILLSACGSSGLPTGAPVTTAAPPAAKDGGTVLILANRQATVAVRPATGAVPSRAPYGMAAPDSSTIVQAHPMNAGTRVVASDPRTGVP